MRIGIVGGGVFGLSAALELARRNHDVTLFDQGEPPHADAASHDHSKALRFEYGAACPLYVPLVEESRRAWLALAEGQERPLYVETGVLALAPRFDEDRHEWLSHNYLAEHGWPVEVWTPAEARRRFPQFSYDGIAAVTWNERGGYLRAAAAVRALAQAARARGVAVVAPVRVAGIEEHGGGAGIALGTGDRPSFDAVLVAAGAWFARLLPQQAALVTATRQFVTYYRPPDAVAARLAAPGFPVWMHDLEATGWYGMPLEAGLLKVARHHAGEPADPDAPRRVHDADRAASRAFVRAAVPAIDPAWYAEDRGCLYAMTEDGHFLIDRVPGCERLFVAAGGSGHGMKLGPAVGRLAADRVEGRPAPAPFRFDALRTGRVA